MSILFPRSARWSVLLSTLALLLAARTLAQQYVLHRFDANGIRRSVPIQAVAPHVELAQSERLVVLQRGTVVRPVQISPQVLKAGRVGALELPETYWAREAGTGAQIQFRPVVLLGPPVTYNPESNDFRGVVSLILEEIGNDVPRTLSGPIDVAVRTDAGTAEPKELSLSHTYLPVQDVQLAVARPHQSVQVRFITSTNPEGYPAIVPVEPAILIQTGQRQLQGFGIEKTNIAISRMPEQSDRPVRLSIAATRGYVEPANVVLSSGSVLVSIRSAGVGEARISARGDGHQAAEATLTYTFPWVFIIAGLLGGCFGSVVRNFGGQKWNNRNFAWRFMWGVLVALVWTVLGVSLLQFGLPAYYNEGAVFAISALGAFFGPVKVKKEAATVTSE